MKRCYEYLIEDHIQHHGQMAFLAGPRQVGKTTITRHCHALSHHYRSFNWDILKDREKILAGYEYLIQGLPVDAVILPKPLLILDEIHKYKQWKNFLKGLIDQYKDQLNIIVSGSAKLNIFRRGGDSLMGRYFLYRVHPLSVAELVAPQWTKIPTILFSAPQKIDLEQWNALFEFGGYPEPFLKQEKRFYNQWQQLRQEQLFKEDIRNLEQIQDLSQMEVLAYQLQHQAGQLLNYSHLANKVRVSDPTIRRWIGVMESFYYCFKVSPWSKNIVRSLLKEPKIYLWDWSAVKEEGAKIENFVASHLLKAIHFWTDSGMGQFGLHFLRDKDKKEVDFLLSKEGKPWILLEVKKSATASLSQSLLYFQSQVKAEIVLQLAFDLPYIDVNCFEIKEPKIVPLMTFLSQLI